MSEKQVQKLGNTSLKNLISSDRFKAQCKKALPKHLSPDRFVRVALTTMLRVPKLAECDQASFLNALLTLSQFGLEPDGRNAHLIPFKNNSRGITECQVIIDYKGLADLVMRSGLVSKIHADVVCDNDDFEYDRGEILHHRINFREPRGEPYAAYALIKMKDGSEKCEVMSKEDIYKVRDKSSGWRAYKKGYGQTPWADDQAEPEMWKKTVFRRATKWLKLSPELADAIDVEDQHEVKAKAVPVEIVPEPTPEPDQITDEPAGEPAEKAKAQDELAGVIESAGFTFDDYMQWGVQTGNIEGEFTCFDDVPDAIAKRHLRSKKGLLNGLAAGKEVA